MNTISNAVTAAIAAVILAGTSPVFAQEQTETAPQEQNPMMEPEAMHEGMQGGDMQGMMGMMQMMSQMSETMENCNRMMKAMAPQGAAPKAEPQQDNG